MCSSWLCKCVKEVVKKCVDQREKLVILPK